MINQTAQILRIRDLRRELLFVRIKRTQCNVEEAEAEVRASADELTRIQRFQDLRGHLIRKGVRSELHALTARKKSEADAHVARLHTEQDTLSREQLSLRQTEAKLDALRTFTDELIGSSEEPDDE